MTRKGREMSIAVGSIYEIPDTATQPGFDIEILEIDNHSRQVVFKASGKNVKKSDETRAMTLTALAGFLSATNARLAG